MNTRSAYRCARLAFSAALLTILAGAGSPAALAAGTAKADRSHGDKAQVTLNLKDADISTLIQTVSEVTGKNFIVDPRVRGKVTVVSSTPMDAGGVYEAFLAVLATQQFAVVPSGEAYKIVPEVNARQEGGTYVSSGAGLPMDEIVTHIYPVKNASAVQLVNVLRPLVAQGGQLAAYVPGNIIILSDRASNVQRIEKIIEQIDVRGDRDIEIVSLQNAAADDVVKAISALEAGDRQADPTSHPPTVIADERSNSVLISGDPDERARLRDIIKRLDAPLKEDSYTQVVFLRYADAESLAPILQGYAQSSQSSSSKSSSGSMFGTSSFGSSSSSSGSGSSGSSAPSPTPAASYSGGGSGGASQVFDHTTIVADKNTNALVISAPPKTMRLVKDVIAKLDIQRRQVLVDAIIAEISANKASELGVDWAAYNPNSIAAAGILNSSTLSALQSAASAAASSSSSSISTSQIVSAAAGLLGQGVIGGFGTTTSNGGVYGALLKALRSDGDTNILSTPSLTVLDNEEAKISVGQEVPFETGQYSNTGTTTSSGVVNPFQTFDRKDVGLSLGITPMITAGESITLKIELENSSLSSGTAGTANLITNKRTISNKVSVRDGQILVLGGLMDDQLSDAQNRIPVLGDIPLIGALFRSHSIQKIKRNLMVFIHPVILSRPDQGDYYTRLKYDSVRKSEVGAAKSAVPLVGGSRPMLYDYDDYLKRNNMPAGAAPTGNDAAPAAAPDENQKQNSGDNSGPAPDQTAPPTPATPPANDAAGKTP